MVPNWIMRIPSKDRTEALNLWAEHLETRTSAMKKYEDTMSRAKSELDKALRIGDESYNRKKKMLKRAMVGATS
jgi:hypothetical protein